MSGGSVVCSAWVGGEHDALQSMTLDAQIIM